MIRRRTSLVLAIVCFTVAALAIGGMIQIANAAEPQKVIGKITIPVGTKIIGLALVNNRPIPFVVISFDDQDLYVLARVEATTDAAGNPVEAGYIVSLDGFRHNCPEHGLEIIEDAITAISDSRIKRDKLKLELF